VGERVSNLAGLKPEEARTVVQPAQPRGAASPASGSDGRGGPYVPLDQPSQQQLTQAFDALDERFDRYLDLFTLIQSRLFEERLSRLMIPNSRPVDGPVGSGFGMRTDPFTERPALHTGLDFPADSGTPILAAAGGVVIAAGRHTAYGQMLEIDHGSGLVTRYAHASKLLVKRGDLVRRGQTVALVGSTGRSTGPHLHFEVLVEGVHQNPAKFLAGGDVALARLAATRSAARGVAEARGVESGAAPRLQRRTRGGRIGLDGTRRAPAVADADPGLPAEPHVAQAPDPDIRQSQRPPVEAVPAGGTEDQRD
jgi:murein DD-endopeptidase MepM/ murein hydrolase activator NlpD